MRHVNTTVVGVAIGLLAVVRAAPAPRGASGGGQDLDVVLARAGTWVERFAGAMSTVVAEEDYEQEARLGLDVDTRRTRADMIVVDVDRAGIWVPFRDVFEVDGRPVRDREERLGRLLGTGTDDALAQAVAISDESARFNLNAFGLVIDRTINTPMAPLIFLLAGNQPRSSFRLDGTTTVGDVACTNVAFSEVVRPSIVRSLDGVARGRFCIEPATGRVVRSELRVDAALDAFRRSSVRAEITVTYGADSSRGVWVPERMDEVYVVGPSGGLIGARTEPQISARATYSRFRQFEVTSSETVR